MRTLSSSFNLSSFNCLSPIVGSVESRGMHSVDSIVRPAVRPRSNLNSDTIKDLHPSQVLTNPVLRDLWTSSLLNRTV